jgi:hypothetical protein
MRAARTPPKFDPSAIPVRRRQDARRLSAQSPRLREHLRRHDVATKLPMDPLLHALANTPFLNIAAQQIKHETARQQNRNHRQHNSKRRSRRALWIQDKLGNVFHEF